MSSFDNLLMLRTNLLKTMAPLERSHGIWYPDDFPVDLSTRQGQMLLKEFHSRFVEEMMHEVLSANPGDLVGELTDALLFYLSMCVIGDLRPPNPLLLESPGPLVPSLFDMVGLSVASSCGAMNLLKARPWRVKFEAPDRATLDHYVGLSGLYLMCAFRIAGVKSFEKLEELYIEKHQSAVLRLQNGY